MIDLILTAVIGGAFYAGFKTGNKFKTLKEARDYIYSQTQIAAFFDENDIPFGALFDKVLDGNIAGSSRATALIVVRSARYVDRPWCRRELAEFRRGRHCQL